MDKEIKEILSYFDDETKNIIIESNLLKYKPTEIRIRLNQSIILSINKQNIKIKNYIITKDILENIFYKMCEYSINAYEKEISNGFITLKNGHRVGIGGVFAKGVSGIVLKELTSLNIRIAHNTYYEINKSDISFSKGILIIGAPHSGKTTFLKSIIKIVSQDENVCVCDEREEIILENYSFDTIKKLNKAVAIEMATRTLNPSLVICDEIGNEKETSAILSSINTGVKFICTAHANEMSQAINRPSIKKLLDSDVFDKIIILDNKDYKIKEIINV